jgi:2-hydroxychromene-2-carboxylate isomerase
VIEAHRPNQLQGATTRAAEALAKLCYETLLADGPAALAAVLTKAGFDAESLAAKAQDPAIKQAVIDNTEKAVERGVFGIPSFFIGKEMFFGKERLGQIEEMLASS